MTRTPGQGRARVRFAPILAVLCAALQAAPVPAATVLRPQPPIYADGDGGNLEEPNAVGCGDGTLVVADTGNSRLLRFVVTDESITASGAIALPQLPYPIGVAVDSNGKLFVLDGRLRRVLRLSAEGAFEAYVEPSGRESFVPRSLAIDSRDHLYLLDVAAGEVVVLDPEGQVVREVSFPEDYGFFSDLAVNRKGVIFALDSVGRQLFRAASADTTLTAFAPGLQEDLDFPTAVTADEHGRLLVADQNGGGIVFLGADGSFQGRQLRMGWKAGWLRYPCDLCIVGDRLFVADRANHRVQVLTMSE